jgi:integrase/recombinase XerC
MAQFARWYIHADPQSQDDKATVAALALSHFLTLDPGRANLAARQWLTSMLASGLAPATVNRRLATLASFVRFGRLVGAVTWAIDVDRPASRPYRNTAGPGLAVAGAMAAVLAARQDSPATRRDRSVFLLAATVGLRRGEIAGLLVCDVDLDAARVYVAGKGRNEKEWIAISRSASDALRAWLEVRASAELTAPLFVGFTRSGRQRSTPLTTDAIYKLIRSLGAEAGAEGPVRPHGLRHTAITTVAQHDGVLAAQRFSRHQKLDTLQVYVDNTGYARDSVDAMAAALDEARRDAAFCSQEARAK